VLRHSTPAARAILAGDWAAGRILVERPSLTQVAKATGVKVNHVAAAARLPAAQRRGIDLKLVSLASLTNRPLTDAAVDKQLTKIGDARVWAWLENRTQPVVVAAE
jgi:hypothetical protein